MVCKFVDVGIHGKKCDHLHRRIFVYHMTSIFHQCINEVRIRRQLFFFSSLRKDTCLSLTVIRHRCIAFTITKSRPHAKALKAIKAIKLFGHAFDAVPPP